MYKVYVLNEHRECIRHVDQLLKYKGQRIPVGPSVNTEVIEIDRNTVRSSSQDSDVHDHTPEWAGCSGDENEREIGETQTSPPSAPASSMPVQVAQGELTAVQNKGEPSVPPTSTPTPIGRSIRHRKPVDYKPYF
ncbi:unnamed protein product [Arctia plantaginis]|uniref:Uncharacterized protein n=1 Tax=Arctia plantaginis TaxID=874455 RepID=A0A8S1AT80_ARCPL|nr:unnamed protein product [Arctia plantaginis]